MPAQGSRGALRSPSDRVRSEFGGKVRIAPRLTGCVVGMRSMPGNPYDGYTLGEAMEQVGILTGYLGSGLSSIAETRATVSRTPRC